jgi:hypothetical protein
MQDTKGRPGLAIAVLVGIALGIGGYFLFANKLDPIHNHDGMHSWGVVFLLSALAGVAGLVITLAIARRAPRTA